MKKFLAIILAGIMTLSLVACGGNTAEPEKPKSNLIGSWTGIYGIASYGEMSEPDKLTLVFTDDGKGTLNYFSDSTDFTWVEDENGVVCTYLNQDFIDTYKLEAFEATVDGDTMVGHLYGFDFTVAKDGTEAANVKPGESAE